MLAPDLVDRLTSPCCGVPLNRMDCQGCGRSYTSMHGVPVLIDFSRSILDEEAFGRQKGESPIDRASPESSRARSARDRNSVAERHVGRMLEELEPGSRVLVVGGATVGKGTEALYETGLAVIGIDIYHSEHVQVLADAHQIPFADGTFDAVIVQAVLEHVLDPTLVVAEIWRVLKPEGLVYAETPFLQQVHEAAYDFTRFTDSGHRWLFRRFELIDSGAVAGPGMALQWSVDYFTRSLLRSRSAGIRSRRLTVPLRWLDNWVDAAFAVDAASCVFFFGRRSTDSLAPGDMADYYKGAQ